MLCFLSTSRAEVLGGVGLGTLLHGDADDAEGGGRILGHVFLKVSVGVGREASGGVLRLLDLDRELHGGLG
jgi:hypothetical protein